MKKIKLFLSIIAFTLISCCAFAAPQPLQIQYDDRYPAPAQEKKPTVLKGGVSQSQELPSGMYGMWQIRGTLLEASDYSVFAPNTSDLWVLRKDGDFVTLINPKNGAKATITVTEVKDNTATFVRATRHENSREMEQVTITLDGNIIRGTDMIMLEYNAMGTKISAVGRYRINGEKINGQTIFRPRNSMLP